MSKIRNKGRASPPPIPDSLLGDPPHRSPVGGATQEGGAIKIAIGVPDYAPEGQCPF